MFNTITNITKTTSSQHVNHIIGNIILRVQAEQKFKAYQGSTNAKQQTSVTKLVQTIPNIGNSIFPQHLIAKYLPAWQAHLERISDYLLPGEGIWWKRKMDGSIEFFDGETSPFSNSQGPLLHHFRSTNFTEEQLYLKTCWEKCLQNKQAIPITQLRIPDINGNMVLFRNDDESEVISNQDEVENYTDKFDPAPTDNCTSKVGTTSCVLKPCCSVEDHCVWDSDSVGKVDAGKAGGINDLTHVGEGSSTVSIEPFPDKTQEQKKNVTEPEPDKNIIMVSDVNDRVTDNEAAETVEQNEVISFKEVSHNSCSDSVTSNGYLYQTKMGHALEKLLGPCKEVEAYDKARGKVKENPGNTEYIGTFQYHTALMQTRVSNQQTKCKGHLNRWENEYFAEHGELPSSKNAVACETARTLLNHIKLSKQLFKNLSS